MRLQDLVVSFTGFPAFVRLASAHHEIEGESHMKSVLRRKAEPAVEEIDLGVLTPRQRDILRLVSVGHTNREIASVLQISVRTVEVHRFNLMRRLNVRNVAQLLRRALQLGLLSKSFGK